MKDTRVPSNILCKKEKKALKPAGSRLAVTGKHLSLAGSELSVSGSRLSVAGNQFSLTRCQLSFPGSKLHLPRCQLSVVHINLSSVRGRLTLLRGNVSLVQGYLNRPHKELNTNHINKSISRILNFYSLHLLSLPLIKVQATNPAVQLYYPNRFLRQTTN